MGKRQEAPKGANDFHYENFLRRSRYTTVFLVLVAAFCVITVLNINTGNVDISISKILRIIFLREGEKMEYNIIWKMVVARAMIYFLGKFQVVSSYTLIIAAFIGALIATGFILLVSRRIHHMATLLVAGIMIGYICSAVTDFVVTFAEDSDIVNLHGWSQGSFSGMNWSNVKVAVIVIGITILITFLMSKPIGAYQLGEAYAQSMGVNIKFFRIMLILTSSVLSACVTAFAGPISFVGIAVPYLVKRSLGTSRPLVVIPATFLGGGVFCMMCDLIARMALAPVELNISTVTSILGAPIVIYMMVKREKGRM